MSRWFRHYAGMVRDDKLVRAALKSKQAIERVVWVWGAVLESAAEIDDNGRYEVDVAEIAHFLRCRPAPIEAVLAALQELGRIDGNAVTAWSRRQFKSDRSNDRVAAHREGKKRSGNVTRNVTPALPERYRNAPETETESTLANANAPIDSDAAFWATAKGYLGASKSSLIGKWVSQHGREATAAAIAAAQVERAVDPVAFIQGRFRLIGQRAEQVSLC